MNMKAAENWLWNSVFSRFRNLDGVMDGQQLW